MMIMMMTMMMIMMLVCSVESIPSDNEDRPARVSDCMKSSHIQKTMKTMKTTPSTTSIATPFETSFTSVCKMIFFFFCREPFCWLFVTRDWLFYTFQFTVCTAVQELFNYLLLSLKLYDIMTLLFIFLVGFSSSGWFCLSTARNKMSEVRIWEFIF